MRNRDCLIGFSRWGWLPGVVCWIVASCWTDGFAQGLSSRRNQAVTPLNQTGRAATTGGSFANSLSPSTSDQGRTSRRERRRRSTTATTATPESTTTAEGASRSSRRRRSEVIGTTPGAISPGSVARAAIQGKSAPPAGPRPSQGAAEQAAVEVELPKMELSPLIRDDVVYFSPSEIKVREGQKFTTAVAFFNASGHAIDSIDLWIHYQPELLEPLWMNGEPLKEHLAEPAVQEVRRAQGYIRFRVKLSPPLTAPLQNIAEMGWRALDGATTAEISLEAPPGEGLGFYTRRVNALEDSDVGNHGLSPMRVTIRDDPEDVAYRQDDPTQLVPSGTDPMIPNPNDAEGRRRGIHLGLVPKNEKATTGEITMMDVVLINPYLVRFDDLRFRLRFDPNAVEILDADEDNYITSGINIYDGGFHREMPFDLHHENRVDQASGAIDYHVGRLNGTYAYPSGKLARVVFRLRQRPDDLSDRTMFWFEPTDGRGRALSDVRSRGRSVLGTREENSEAALHNAEVVLAPQ